MKIKRLLKFYYTAGNLNRALDNIITDFALASARDEYRGGEYYFTKITRIIGVKRELGLLWSRLDNVIAAMTDRDRLTLKKYAMLRRGTKGDELKEIHRAQVKFTRRAQGLLNGGEELYKILCAYQYLSGRAPD